MCWYDLVQDSIGTLAAARRAGIHQSPIRFANDVAFWAGKLRETFGIIISIFLHNTLFGRFPHFDVFRAEFWRINFTLDTERDIIFWFRETCTFVAAENMASEALGALTCPWTSGLENARSCRSTFSTANLFCWRKGTSIHSLMMYICLAGVGMHVRY